jgi:hypothetical protein
MLRIMREMAPMAADPDGRSILARTGSTPEPERFLDKAGPPPDLARVVDEVLGRWARERMRQKGTVRLTEPKAYWQALDEIRRDSALFQEMASLLDAGKYAELAGFCRDTMGRRAFHACLRRELKAPTVFPETHHAIVRTPYACIVTTNFDTLLENAYGALTTRGVPKVPTGAELAQHGTLLFDEAFFILKAHGDLDDDASIVLTSDDYRRVIHANPAFQATLGGILQRYAILFVGYSLSDVNFRLLLDNQLTVFNGHVPPRYAILEDAGNAEREILWRTAKLRVISYEKGKHDAVRRFLVALADASTAPLPAPATDRAAAAPRPVLEPEWGPRVELAIVAQGDRIVLGLSEMARGEAPRTLWSGGASWPDWGTLRNRMERLSRSGQVELPQISEVGSHLRRVMPDELTIRLDDLQPGIPVLLSLSPATEVVPWEWLIVSGSPLCLRNSVVRRPIGISDKARGLRLPSAPLRALLIADAGLGTASPMQGLPGSAREAKGIAERLVRDGHSVTTLKGPDATYARLMEEVAHGEYDVIHFASHAGIDRAESYLMLWDGRVTSSELASVLYRRSPALLVLNTHCTAFAYGRIAVAYDAGEDAPPGVDRPLSPSFGFAEVAARSGVGAFVGTFSEGLSDDGAAEFALSFYDRLLQGVPFAVSLHHARRETTRLTDVTGLFYVGYGCAELRAANGTR